LDWGQESFIVLDTAGRGWKNSLKINLKRLEGLLGVSDGFRMPRSHDFESSRSQYLEVQRFPAWLFCPRCRKMQRWGRREEVDNEEGTPKCRSCRGASRKESVLVPMRYVAACSNGHISDVDWWRWAHSNSRSSDDGPCDRSRPDLSLRVDKSKGSAIDALVVHCNACKKERSLKEISRTGILTSIGQRCSGRQPWQKRDDAEDCRELPQALLRSQTAVHFSDVVSALDLTVGKHDVSISDFDREMIECVKKFEEVGAASTLDEFLANINNVVLRVSKRTNSQTDDMKKKVEQWLRNHFATPEDNDRTSSRVSSTEDEALLDEEWGYLSRPTDNVGPDSRLIVSREEWPTSSETGGLATLVDAVYLVEKLREVRVMRGFRRVAPDGRLIPPNLKADQTSPWLPATEVFGEGIFIQLSNERLKKWENDNEKFLGDRLHHIQAQLGAESWISDRFANYRDRLARFIMVHTLSHILMWGLCYESGYSAASVRERLYVFPDRAGLLLYTADGDSEGSLGGLVRQGRSERFAKTLTSALERAQWCSNDPICREMPEHGPGKLNRAACHACAFAAETSCGYLNTLLDRNLVVGMGTEVTGKNLNGFFDDVFTEET
jgi:hypothetical protein